jgi:transcriptional pleiotropic repressor
MVAAAYTVIKQSVRLQASIEHKRKQDAAKGVINALSFSELEAAVHICQALPTSEGLLVAGHVADRLGFTRSVVVNALRKLESAGVVETRSLGMKGTYIKFKDALFKDELDKLK